MEGEAARFIFQGTEIVIQMGRGAGKIRVFLFKFRRLLWNMILKMGKAGGIYD